MCDTDTTIKECIHTVECRLNEYHDEIVQSTTNAANSDTWAVKQFVKKARESPQVPVYLNEAITFRTMFHAMGEILNKLCMDIMPRLSMTDAMSASIFQLVYLRDFNLLQSFGPQINLPILYRMLLACFQEKDNENHGELAVRYLQKQHSTIYHILTSMPSLCSADVDQLPSWMAAYAPLVISGLDTIVASADATDKDRLEVLYWSINHVRKNTLEYYLVIVALNYTQLSTSGAHSRELNRKTAVSALFKVLACLYNYVMNLPRELVSVHVLTDTSFGKNAVYRTIIHQALSELISVHGDGMLPHTCGHNPDSQSTDNHRI